MEYSKVEIKSLDGTLAELRIDGKTIHGVRSIAFRKDALNMPVLTIDMNALDISIDSPVVIRQKGYEDCEIRTIDGHSMFSTEY